MTGNSGNNQLNGSLGADTMTGGAGRDTLLVGGDSDVDRVRVADAANSSSVTRDLIQNFEAGEDKFDLDVAVSLVFTLNQDVTLNEATFDQNLDNKLDSILLPGMAILFDPNNGDLNQPNMMYLVVDGNGVNGYQAGEDYVFQLQFLTGTFNPDGSDFI